MRHGLLLLGIMPTINQRSWMAYMEQFAYSREIHCIQGTCGILSLLTVVKQPVTLPGEAVFNDI